MQILSSKIPPSQGNILGLRILRPKTGVNNSHRSDITTSGATNGYRNDTLYYH